VKTRKDPETLAQTTYRADIDGLRAIAVISVVIFHAFPRALSGGFVGVDIFFVISGFLISTIIFGSIETNRFSFLQFYARRIRRIFPALALLLIACITLGWWLLLANEYRQLGKHVGAGATFISNFALWNESGYFDAAANEKPLLHLWSLGIEEQFYLLWPFLLWMAYRRRKNFLFITLLIAVASFISNVSTVTRYPVATFYSPLTRFWELMLGGILAYLLMHKPQTLPQHSVVSSLTGFLMIAVALCFLTTNNTFPGWWALLPTIGTFLILSVGPTGWFNRHVLSNRVLVFVGLISYPLYLWHWPLLYFSSQVSALSSHLTRLIAVAASGVAATMTYLWIEKPIRRAKAVKPSAVYLAVGMALCGLAGATIYLMGGLGFRLPQQFAHFTHLPPGEDTHTDCFLEDKSNFLANCTEVLRRPALFVWGDSHADRLYWGLKSMQEKGQIGLLQVTGASCPPILGFKSYRNNKCEDVNAYALQSIRRTRPDIVLLHASWVQYSVDIPKLAFTIQQLRDAGVGKIVLLGPVPLWSGGTILRSLFRCWRPLNSSTEFPRYSRCGLDSRVSQVSNQLRRSVERLNVEYISAYDALCNRFGCLTHVFEDGDQLVTYDYGHLSTGGSKYLINAISTKLLAASNGTEFAILQPPTVRK